MGKFPNRLTLLLILLVTLLPASAQQRFRGAWIATVANIDWPSSAAVGNAELQKQEMIKTLDELAKIGINAVIFQVRPTADALYLSYLEPTSHWITGKQGDAIGYDPLAMVVEEAHKRGMEVHAWLNPYRVNLPNMDMNKLAMDHIFRLQPEWFWKYGSQYYFNPALAETRDWICGVVEDIVCRYGVDAIHMDDYFYPYPIKNKPLPDIADFTRDPRGFVSIDDWRRDNVNKTVEAISKTIRATNPKTRFGISPFGVWRNLDPNDTTSNLPKGSATRAGITNYDHLYADILLWIKMGWIDYVAPQVYWEIGKTIADYRIITEWWADQMQAIRKANPDNHCQLYIGMASYRLGGEKENKAWKEGNEIARQMRLNLSIDGVDGECFYSTRPLLKNPLHVCDSIRQMPK